MAKLDRGRGRHRVRMDARSCGAKGQSQFTAEMPTPIHSMIWLIANQCLEAPLSLPLFVAFGTKLLPKKVSGFTFPGCLFPLCASAPLRESSLSGPGWWTFRLRTFHAESHVPSIPIPIPNPTPMFPLSASADRTSPPCPA